MQLPAPSTGVQTAALARPSQDRLVVMRQTPRARRARRDHDREGFCGIGRDFLSRSWKRAVSGLIVGGLIVPGAAGATAAAGASRGYRPPLPLPMHVLRAFSPPAHPWQAGNRGVDLAAYAGEPVYAAAAGVVLYAGLLAGRGVVSVRHDTLRTTYEPLDPVVGKGDLVTAGQLIGYVSDTADFCGPPGSCLHWGALRAGGYVDPMGLLRTVTVRLLPIWSAASAAVASG